MHLHLLLTPELSPIPKTCKIVHDFGPLVVVFDGFDKEGKHCVVEDTQENIITWLKPFDGFVKGNGNPMMESFTIVHVKEGL